MHINFEIWKSHKTKITYEDSLKHPINMNSDQNYTLVVVYMDRRFKKSKRHVYVIYWIQDSLEYPWENETLLLHLKKKPSDSGGYQVILKRKRLNVFSRFCIAGIFCWEDGSVLCVYIEYFDLDLYNYNYDLSALYSLKFKTSKWLISFVHNRWLWL